MPQLVESLGFKSVTQIAVGLDFMLALGLDYDQFGHTMARQQPQQPVVFAAPEPYEEKYISRQEVVSRDASPYQKPDYSSYTPQQPSRSENTGRPPIIQNNIEKTPTAVAKQSSYQNLNLNVATDDIMNSRRSSYAGDFRHTEE